MTHSVWAATYTVTGTSDTTSTTVTSPQPGDQSVTSLRDAILQGNASSDTNITIILPAGTITLAGALPMISNYSAAGPAATQSKTWTINGPSSGVTIDGGGNHRGLFLSPTPTTPTDKDIPQNYPHTLTVNLNNITLNNMKAKGGDVISPSYTGGGGMGGNVNSGTAYTGGGGLGGNVVNISGNGGGGGIGTTNSGANGGTWNGTTTLNIGQNLSSGMTGFSTGGTSASNPAGATGNPGDIGGGGGQGNSSSSNTSGNATGGTGGFGGGGWPGRQL